ACAIKKMLRSHLRRRRRGGRSHAQLRASDFSSWLRPIGLAFVPLMPVRSYQRWLRGIFLRSRPPLLCNPFRGGTGVWPFLPPRRRERTLAGGTRAFFSAYHRNNEAHENRTLNRVRRSEEHTSELQSRSDLVCRLLLEKKKKIK